MSQLTIILWLLTIIIDTAGQLAFKAAAVSSNGDSALSHWRYMLVRPWIWIGISCYIFEFILWLAFLSLVPLSVGVMLGSINIVAIMIAGRIWFQERLTTWRVMGCLLIALGVAVVGIN